jgi:hypothetical protein
LHSYVLPFPLKTARELKKEMAGWQDKSVTNIQRVCQKRLGLPSCCVVEKP